MRTSLSPAAGAALVPDGATAMIGGFMGVGSPHRIIAALVAHGARGLIPPAGGGRNGRRAPRRSAPLLCRSRISFRRAGGSRCGCAASAGRIPARRRARPGTAARCWNSASRPGSARTARGGTPRASANAASAPLASPMLHSTGCTRQAPLVTRVVPRFLQAGSRFSTRTGSSAPSGIWNGKQSMSTVSRAAGGARVEVDAVGADADAVGEALGALGARPGRDADVLLQKRGLGADAPPLAPVDRLGQSRRRCRARPRATAGPGSRCRRRAAAPRSASSGGRRGCSAGTRRARGRPPPPARRGPGASSSPSAASSRR